MSAPERERFHDQMNLGITGPLVSKVWSVALPGSFIELQLHCPACKGVCLPDSQHAAFLPFVHINLCPTDKRLGSFIHRCVPST